MNVTNNFLQDILFVDGIEDKLHVIFVYNTNEYVRENLDN